ncbi:MAG: glycosyltransferase [Thermoanaerobaculia bacterium]
MRVLIVATKSPWPPVDGGRLLLSLTLEGLEREGCRFTLIAPEVGPVSPALALGRSWQLPLALARHAQPVVRQEVERRLAAERFDVVHVEQLQALPQAEPALRRGIPVVLRAENVESDLWAATAALTPGWKGRVLAREARRLARWEGEAVRRVAATLPLSEEDAARLRQLAGGGRVRVVRAPFPELVPGPSSLAGDPPVVLLVSRGWLPNEDSVRWFLGEAWARGVPVVGTSAAVSGLEVETGREALVADDPAAFARAVARLRSEPGLAQRLVEEGRRALRERHEPARVVADLLSVYEEVRGTWPAARSEGS